MPASPPPSAPQGAAPAAVTAQSLAQSFVAVLTRPAPFWESVRAQTGFGPPLLFAAVMGAVAGVLLAIVGVVGLGGGLGAFAGLGAIVFMPIAAVVFGSFVGGGVVHLISLVAGGKGSYEQSVRVASYSLAVVPISALVGFIPLVSVLPSLYGLYLVALGVVAIHLADRKRSFVVAGVLAALAVLLTVVGLFAGRAAQRAADELQARYGEESAFQREMQRAGAEMQRALQEAQRNAERQQKEESGK